MVDPRGSDYSKYRGVTLVTPNRLEAQLASGIEVTDVQTLTQAGAKLLELVDSKAVLIRGDEGMSLFTREEGAIHISATFKEMSDVTGVGDTVAGMLALVISTGVDLHLAAYLANYSAGIVARKLGTYAVTPSELLRFMEADEYFATIDKVSATKQNG